MQIDTENRERASERFRKTWEEFREGLGKNIVEYNDLKKAKEYTFLKVLDDVLTYKKNLDSLEIKFNSLYNNFSFCRATQIKTGEDFKMIQLDRFLPKEEFIKDDNRFSPKGIEYLYLACKSRFGRETRYQLIEEIALKEIRAEKGMVIGICKFKIPYTDKIFYRKIIDLTISDKISFEELDKEFDIESNINSYIMPKNKINREKLNSDCYRIVESTLLKMYFKLLSSEIFRAVNNVSKGYEYAPFHCMACYFQQLGFDGIMYKSTVCDSENGNNIVLFDKSYAEPFDFRIIDIQENP